MNAFAYLIEPPFNYRDHDGAVTGCDVELARTVLDMVGVPDVEFVEADFSQLLPGLSDGRWRMTTGLFATEERRTLAAFSKPIWTLPDGLLVRKGNPLRLTAYRSAVQDEGCTLAVVRDQIQHHAAVASGMPAERILVFETYHEAARAVLDDRAQAFASVARAHSGFIDRSRALLLDVVTLKVSEKEPAAGCFGFRMSDRLFVRAIDEALTAYLGSRDHRSMMQRFGFSDTDIDLIA